MKMKERRKDKRWWKEGGKERRKEGGKGQRERNGKDPQLEIPGG